MRTDDRATVRPHRVDAGPHVAEAHLPETRQAMGQPLADEGDVLIRSVAPVVVGVDDVMDDLLGMEARDEPARSVITDVHPEPA